MVEGDAEPLVDLSVDGVVLVHDLPRGHPLLHRLRFRLSPVLVRAADVQRVVAAEPTEPARIWSNDSANLYASSKFITWTSKNSDSFTWRRHQR